MKNCESVLLAEMPNSNVVKCLESGCVRWYFNNLMVTFLEEDFLVFSKSFQTIDFNIKSWQTEEGGRFIVINTCHQSIQFVIKEYEHRQLSELFEKARTELEILQILNG
ncbi:DUF6686 family protein [Arthrospiribacter ruber]|uniref:Uncharacterized protein n=1 Tax=Arthrospiribacter ruber TaxID=2487934 RepID=A0A951J145_9BACT|nr:DUF6686 family protein [Arthrospiribacter ruber]MBW3469582.1 hypothetical protein [Arthrospiribacter ruber]